MFSIRCNSSVNHEEIKKDLQRIIKIKPFIKKYNWERINSLSGKCNWKKTEKTNVKIAENC